MPLKTFTSGEVLTAGDVNLYLANVVIQANSTTITGVFSTTSTSFVDVTGLNVSITPKATTSKILVTVSGLSATSVAGSLTRINLMRDSTPIGISTGGVSNQSMHIITNTQYGDSFSIGYLDSPSSTSAITYKVQIANAASAGTSYLGRNGTNANYGAITTITVMEISQ